MYTKGVEVFYDNSDGTIPNVSRLINSIELMCEMIDTPEDKWSFYLATNHVVDLYYSIQKSEDSNDRTMKALLSRSSTKKQIEEPSQHAPSKVNVNHAFSDIEQYLDTYVNDGTSMSINYTYSVLRLLNCYELIKGYDDLMKAFCEQNSNKTMAERMTGLIYQEYLLSYEICESLKSIIYYRNVWGYPTSASLSLLAAEQSSVMKAWIKRCTLQSKLILGRQYEQYNDKKSKNVNSEDFMKLCNRYKDPNGEYAKDEGFCDEDRYKKLVTAVEDFQHFLAEWLNLRKMLAVYFPESKRQQFRVITEKSKYAFLEVIADTYN
jgi:hypothetical protein